MDPLDRPTEVTVVAHHPERRSRSTVLVAAACSSCCCCCVHSIGGLAGALVASLRGPKAEAGKEDPPADASRAPLRHALKVYWLSLAAVSAVTLGICLAGDLHEPVVGPAVLAVFLPVGQLLASLLSLIHLHAFPPPGKRDSLARLGRITLYAFTGGLLGGLVTFLILVTVKW